MDKYHSSYLHLNPIENCLLMGERIGGSGSKKRYLASNEVAMIVKTYAKQHFKEQVGVFFCQAPLDPIFKRNKG